MRPEQLNRLFVAYLEKKGYTGTSNAFKREARVQSLEERAYAVASEMEGDLAAQVYAYCTDNATPQRYRESYELLRKWIDLSLDVYKAELKGLLYPVFVHCYLEQVQKGHIAPAIDFFRLFQGDHPQNAAELNSVAAVQTQDAVNSNQTALLFLRHKHMLRMCAFSFELLMSFLQDSRLMLLLSIINRRLDIQVFTGQPQQPSETTPVVVGSLTGMSSKELSELHAAPVRWGLLDEQVAMLDAATGGGSGSGSGTKRRRDGKDSGSSKDSGTKDGAGKDGAGKDAAAGGADGDAATGRGRVPLPAMTDKQELAFFDDLRRRVTLHSASLPSCCMYTFLNAHDELNTMALSGDGGMVAGGFADSTLRVWDLHAYREGGAEGGDEGGEGGEDEAPRARAQHFVGHSGPVYGTSFSPDGAFLLSSSEDATARLWSMETRSNVVLYRGHNFPVWDVKFSPLGYYFATASNDRTARLWATSHLHPLRIFAGHLADVDVVEWHPNCQYLATGSADRTVRLFDISTGSCARLFLGHKSGVSALAFSPDGRALCTATHDGTLTLFDIASGKVIKQLAGHKGPVYSLAFSHEGALLASGGADTTVRLWDVNRYRVDPAADGRPPVPPAAGGDHPDCVQTLRTKSTPVYSVHFSRRNLLLAGGAFKP